MNHYAHSTLKSRKIRKTCVICVTALSTRLLNVVQHLMISDRTAWLDGLVISKAQVLGNHGDSGLMSLRLLFVRTDIENDCAHAGTDRVSSCWREQTVDDSDLGIGQPGSSFRERNQITPPQEAKV